VSEKSTPAKLKETFGALAPWKRKLHVLAGVVLVVGLGMRGAAMIGDGSTDDPGSSADRGDASRIAKNTSAKSGESGKTEGVTAIGILPGAEPRVPTKTTNPGGEASGGAPGGDGGDASSTSSGDSDEAPPFLDEWSPTLVKGGLGFFVAFWIGYSIRVFAKIVGLFAGLFSLGVLGLQQLGWVTVEWDVAHDQFAALPGFIAEQFSGFKTFLQGSLPSAGMASLGLFAGLKKK
jgi:uncharacterized membrane protein (Fun14 family)